MAKGVMRIDDARRAVDAGFSAISVSNHGGNNLDGTPSPLRVLHGIASEVGDRVEVVLDGGVRRGGDVAKAVALGARAVMIGRAYLWGLAANGQAGVENVLDVLRNGLDSALLGSGVASVHDLRESDIVVPEGFHLRLGDAGCAPRSRSDPDGELVDTEAFARQGVDGCVWVGMPDRHPTEEHLVLGGADKSADGRVSR